MGLIPHDQPREYREKREAKSGIEVGLALCGCGLGMSTNREGLLDICGSYIASS